jgi:ATP-dependent Clp protease ATP-binding subunit ClpB
LLRLESELHKRVVGQEEAITAVADAVRRSRAGLQDQKKPLGSFIFIGTTGVGKTELARALAAFLFNDENLLTRIDMSEYQERHSVSRLIGAPPGYVGYEEGGQLTEAVRRRPYAVILLDEIEKAHQDVFNILLQVLDDGRLTDNQGRTVDFRNTILIMTSNLGSDLIMEEYASGSVNDKDSIYDRIKSRVLQLLRQSLRPEFLNRIDEVVVFKPLTEKDIGQIVTLEFANLQKRLSDNGLTAILTENAIAFLAKDGYDPQFGARPLKRAIKRTLTDKIANLILSGNLPSGAKIVIDADPSGLVFNTETGAEEKAE